MVLVNREKVSIHGKAKTELISLVKQITWIALGFTVMLLLTKGKPPTLVVNMYLCLCSLFFASRELQRFKKESEEILIISQVLNHTDSSDAKKELDELEKIIHLKSQAQDIHNVNLIFANLKNAQLANVDLNCVYLSGSNLSHANLSGANLGNANLSGAQLVS